MSENKGITVISYSLSILYGISALVSLATFAPVFLRNHFVIIAVLFLFLFGVSLAVIRMKEWARQLLLALNVMMFFYFSAIFLKYPTPTFFVYVLLFFITALYFNRMEVKVLFQPVFYGVRKSVLVVDDDETFVKTIKGILLSNGYSVLTATTGEKGLQVAKMQKPDVIVLDVILPGIKGRDVCALLKNDPQTQNVPIIFLTAKDSPDDIKAELAAGGNCHLSKPLHAKQLLTEIKRIIG
jgi:twitching motility two-component system response regulator PilH